MPATPMPAEHVEQSKAAGALVRAKRTEKGLTLQQVADRLGVHKTYVSLLELGRYNPVRSKHAAQLFALLGITGRDLQDIAPDLVLTTTAVDTRRAGERIIPHVGPLSQAATLSGVMGVIGDDPSLEGYSTGDLMAGTLEDATFVPADLHATLTVGSVVVWHTLRSPRPGQLTVIRSQDGRHALARHGSDPDTLLVPAGPATAILRGAGVTDWQALGPVVQVRTRYRID